MFKTVNLLVLAGDGVGPEVMNEALKLLDAISSNSQYRFNLIHSEIGGCSIDSIGLPIASNLSNLLSGIDAVLLGAVGGPKWDNIAKEIRPEQGLLQLRSSMRAFANYRPAILDPSLSHSSTIKEEYISGLDILIIRELVSGIYFGKPRGIIKEQDGVRRAFNTMVYTEDEIEQIAHLAFKAARARSGKLCSVDKANVLEVSILWREVVESVSKEYPDVSLEHMYVDNAAMQLIRAPKAFDVIVTGNLFGDILSDCAAMLTGSIGMLPSASLNEDRVGIYEPVHGSAPDIAGKNVVNPIAMILSLAMMFEFSLDDSDMGATIRAAVSKVLKQGKRTQDIVEDGATEHLSTSSMGDAIVEEFLREVLV